MKSLCAAAALLSAIAVSFALDGDFKPPRGNYDFPIYTNQPPGKQITANQLPATTHALSPEDTRKLIQVPPGFEVRLFAAEPMVVNPVAMTWDERGRLWVLELYEYPKGAPKGEKGRDRIKILEDTDADGVADKVTVFAEGFSLAEGMILGNGGVYVGAPPNLYFLRDTNNDDKADTREVVLTGFGDEDRHELLNGFAWGPDGWLYMTHGVFTHSNVRQPKPSERGLQAASTSIDQATLKRPEGRAPVEEEDDGVRMDAALARFHPITKKFEVFADGTSNPWGVDWNERGDAFVSACVIQHLFHMAPGGQYNRQGGTWANPYGYVSDLPSKGLPAIVDWRHYRAAHAGITIYQGDQWPAEWRGLVFLGNIHQSALNCDRLTPVGATYKAEKESTLLRPAGKALLAKSGEKIPKGEDWKFVGPGNFLVSRDPWFRPVSNKTGPDGALWVMDWYDKYPCYQNAQADPNGVDREYGRIWRVVWVGNQPGKPVPSRPTRDMDLTRLDYDGRLRLLSHTNSWHARQGRRLIAESRDPQALNFFRALLRAQIGEKRLMPKGNGSVSLNAFTTLHAADAVWPTNTTDPAFLSTSFTNSAIKMALARSIGDKFSEFRSTEKKSLDRRTRRWMEEVLKPLHLLETDVDPAVRATAASALRQITAGSLTGNARPSAAVALMDKDHFKNLLARPSVEGDFYYPHIVWMAMEPRVAADPQPFLPLLAANENSVSAYCARRVMRRICDLSDSTSRQKYLNAAMQWLGDNAAKSQIAGAALDGMIEAQKSKGAPPSIDLVPIFAKLNSNPALADKARRLATLLGDTSASKALIAKINDPNASIDERLKGIQAARDAKDEAARAELLKLVRSPLIEGTGLLKTEAIRALATFGGNDSDATAYAIVDAWKNLFPPTRRAAAEVLVTKSKWSRALLAGADNKLVKPEDISATARRALARSDDSTVREHAEQLFGRYRATGDDKLKLIAEKKKIVLSGTPDLNNGHEVARRTCFVCHKLHGEGADVGPDLTGVGRSTIDALLHNVIDPNEVIGAGYETTEVTLKDDSTVSGRVVEETDTRIKLIAAGPTENTIAKSDIKMVNGKPAIRKTELSLMPEGLEQIPDKDFRDLIMFILNPPGDNRPWTPALRKELIGDDAQKSADATDAIHGKGLQPGDGESVALWNPDWKVSCPPFEGAPRKLVEFAGRRNVLMTHPTDRNTPAALERTLEIPSGGSALNFFVAADEQGDWELRVIVNGQMVHKQLVDKSGERWKRVSIDLSKFANMKVALRLENCANGWSYEFGYWSEVELGTRELRASAK